MVKIKMISCSSRCSEGQSRSLDKKDFQSATTCSSRCSEEQSRSLDKKDFYRSGAIRYKYFCSSRRSKGQLWNA